MAAVGSMYRVKPLYNVEEGIVLPDVMYKVNRLIAPVTGLQQEKSPQTLEQRQETLLQKLDAMITAVSAKLGETTTTTSGSGFCEILQPDCPGDIVIRANPSQPLLWLNSVKNMIEEKEIKAWWKFHTHSSVTTTPSLSSFPTKVQHQDRHQYQLIVTVIWSCGGQCPSLHVSPCHRTPICGETNIFRFFARLLGVYDTSSVSDAIIDLCLDTCDVILSPTSSNQDKASTLKSITNAVEKGVWFGATPIPLVEAFLASVMTVYDVTNIPQESLKSWVRDHAGVLSGAF